MIGIAPGARVMVSTRPVDFRKGPDALAALIGAEYGGILDRFTRPLTLAQTAAELRNNLQHGSTDLIDPTLAFQMIEVCKGLIEEMYR